MNHALPVLDAHIHLDPSGTPEEAVKRFLSAGGTHLIVVHKPYGNMPEGDVDGIKEAYNTTIRMKELAERNGVRAWCVLGPYPGLLPRLVSRLGAEEAENLFKEAIDIAIGLVDEGAAIGIGEIGRVHFPVEEFIQSSLDRIIMYAFRKARQRNCPVVLHTESPGSNRDLFRHLSSLAESTGMRKEKIIKHYSGWEAADPRVSLGLSVSMQARRNNLEQALRRGYSFLLETDYIDDPSRPNVVMPPDTVPRKVEWCYRKGLLDAELHQELMIELPERVLGVNTSDRE